MDGRGPNAVCGGQRVARGRRRRLPLDRAARPRRFGREGLAPNSGPGGAALVRPQRRRRIRRIPTPRHPAVADGSSWSQGRAPLAALVFPQPASVPLADGNSRTDRQQCAWS